MNLNMLSETFRQALKNIASNKFRTLLTMLGIIIGIMAVILIVGLGNGMTQSMRDAFSSMGTNTLTVSVPGFGSRTVDVDEMYALAGENPDLFEGVSPVVSLSGSVKVGSATLDQTSASGVSEDYLEMSGYTVSKGRGLQYLDMDDNKKVCVVGPTSSGWATAATPWARPSRWGRTSTPSWACWKPVSATCPPRRAATTT